MWIVFYRVPNRGYDNSEYFKYMTDASAFMDKAIANGWTIILVTYDEGLG